jgi:hypothetical protein
MAALGRVSLEEAIRVMGERVTGRTIGVFGTSRGREGNGA